MTKFLFWGSVPRRGTPPDLISSADGRNEFALRKFSAAFGGCEFTAHSRRPAVRGPFFSISFLPSGGIVKGRRLLPAAFYYAYIHLEYFLSINTFINFRSCNAKTLLWARLTLHKVQTTFITPIILAARAAQRRRFLRRIFSSQNRRAAEIFHAGLRPPVLTFYV